MMEQAHQRLSREKAEKARMEEERCERHLTQVEKLTNEREELIRKLEGLVQRRRELELGNKKIKDHF